MVAGYAAMFDHLAGGASSWIGPGGLVSNSEPRCRPGGAGPQMMQESIDAILRLWTEEPPYDIPGRFLKIPLNNHVYPEFGVGTSRPPAAPSAHRASLLHAELRERPDRRRARVDPAGPVLPPALPPGDAGRRCSAEGCEVAGRRPDADIWRVSRSVLVTETESEAGDYLADPGSGLELLLTAGYCASFSRLRKALFMVKGQLEMPDEDVTVDTIKRALMIAGRGHQVLDQLVSLREETWPARHAADGGPRLGPARTCGAARWSSWRPR